MADNREVLYQLGELAKRDFLIYCYVVNPNLVIGPHLRLIADKCQDLILGKLRRLMIFMAPRSGKSHMGSIHLPSWALGLHPYWHLMAISYGIDLAMDFSREVRGLVTSPEYQSIFPGVMLRKDAKAANRWMTRHGGKFQVAGITSRIAGKGANMAVIDDPLSEQDAWSESARAHAARRYFGGFYTRLMPDARILLMTTRWHLGDLAGYLMDQQKSDPLADQWNILSIPA